jgi:lysophospholipase L1-like esterase
VYSKLALLLALTPVWGQQVGKLVIVGDSLSAGFQNFSLYDSQSAPGVPLGGQRNGYAALIAQQAGVSLNLPLVSYPGVPPAFSIDATGNITRPPALGNRENPLVQTLDLSVPGFLLADALSHSVNLVSPANAIDVMALDVLGFPGLATNTAPCGAVGFANNVLTLSEVACAVEQAPNTILVSIGNNDVLQTLTTGVPPTNVVTFATEFIQLLQGLSTTHARIVVANIPDVTQIPYLMTSQAFQQKCGFAATGAGPNDFVVANVENPFSNSGNICNNYAVRFAAMVQQAKDAVLLYNIEIEALAATYGATVVDINGLVNQIAEHGYEANGRRLTTAFLGGLFSLDGIHPTNTGYAIIANEFIKTMNSHLHTGIPPVSVAQIAKTDPLVPAK